MPAPRTRHPLSSGCTGFGLIDTLIALTLLAVSLLGVSGGVHYALRATHATVLQTQAVDLIADLAEDLHLPGASDNLPALLAGWQARVQQSLPARDFDPPRLTHAAGSAESQSLTWLEVEMGWKDRAGIRDGSLVLPVTSPGSEAIP